MVGKHTSEKIKAKAKKKKGGNHQENGKVTKTKPPTKRKREDSRNKKKIVNGKDENDERDVAVVPDSESESQEDNREGYENGEMAPDSENEVEGSGEEEEEVESLKISKKKSNRKDEGKVKKNGKVNEAAAHIYSFPMHRISRMIKSDDPDIRPSQEAVFLINKASEKFLELFAKEGYANAFFDKKKHVEYKHLSTVVCKRRRFDFLSDFVPEKVKAEDALAETSLANP